MELMRDLEKRISGEWFDLREAATDQYTLNAHLNMSAPRLSGVGDYLRMCVEEGLLEYKGSILRPMFVLLEETRYQNLRPEQLSIHEAPLQNLAFVILLQRMICTGVIELPRETSGDEVNTEGLNVNTIIADIKDRIKKNPEFKNDPAVKNILLQVGIYQKERVKMQELLPMIKDEKRETFRENYGNIFARVFESIRRNYEVVLQQEEEKRLDEKTSKELMHLLNLKSLSPLLLQQAQAISRAGSTLSFAAEDKYKTRQFLVALYQEKDDYLGLITKEQNAYTKICSELGINDERCTHKISSRFRDLLIRVLEKISQVEE